VAKKRKKKSAKSKPPSKRRSDQSLNDLAAALERLEEELARRSLKNGAYQAATAAVANPAEQDTESGGAQEPGTTAPSHNRKNKPRKPN
jgi:hypothetical protein